jgi:hypothetical protein
MQRIVSVGFTLRGALVRCDARACHFDYAIMTTCRDQSSQSAGRRRAYGVDSMACRRFRARFHHNWCGRETSRVQAPSRPEFSRVTPGSALGANRRLTDGVSHSSGAVGSRTPFSRQTGSEETRSEPRPHDKPRCDISGLFPTIVLDIRRALRLRYGCRAISPGRKSCTFRCPKIHRNPACDPQIRR